MQRITDPDAVSSLPAPSSTGTTGFFADGDPATGTYSTVVTPDWTNGVQEELIGIIEAVGLTPDIADNAQVLAAIKVLAGGGTYTVATLPAASAAWPGRRAMVTDATNPTFLGALTGGGSTECPVVYTSAGWVAG